MGFIVNSTLVSLQSKLDRLTGERDSVLSQQKECLNKIASLERQLEIHRHAQVLLQLCGEAMRERITQTVSSLVQPALQAVYGPGIQFSCEYREVPSGYRLELKLEANGIKADPLEAFGGGVSDVVSLSLRAACLILGHQHQAKLLVLDESFKHVDNSHVELIGKLLRDFADKLGIQILLVTHQREFSEHSDIHLEVKRDSGGVSIVERVKE